MQGVWFILFSILGVSNCLPVVLIPGLGGSALEVKLDALAPARYACKTQQTGVFFKIWLNESLIQENLGCAVALLSVYYSALLGTTFSPLGVTVRPVDVGNLTGVQNVGENHPVYAEMIKFLEGKGYVEGVNMSGCPYDFRKGSSNNDEDIENLKRVIENTSQMNDGARVVLICHSMGGLLSLKLLNSVSQEWKDKHVERLISLSAVYGGAVEAILTTLAGYYGELKTFGFTTIAIRTLVRQMTATYWLFPNKDVFPEDEILVTTPSHNYTASEMLDLLIDAGDIPGSRIFPKESINLSAPGVEVQCLYGTGVKTLNRIIYNSSRDFPFNPKLYDYGDGDGTVNLASLETCKRWVGQGKTVNVKTFPNVNHSAMITNSEIMEYIGQFL